MTEDDQTPAPPQLPTHGTHLTLVPTLLSKAKDALAGPTEKEGTAELLSCLALCAPSGMTTDERQAWVKVARQTLSGIPADLLKYGCQAARETCRFPSEIVPKIVTEVGEAWDRRKRTLLDAQRAWDNRNAQRIEQQKPVEPDYITADEFRAALKGIVGNLTA